VARRARDGVVPASTKRGGPKSILELGAETGLASLACLLLGRPLSAVRRRHRPRGAPADAAPARCFVRSAMGPALEGPAASDCALPTKHFDVANLSDPLPPAEVVAAADVLYDPRDGSAEKGEPVRRGGQRARPDRQPHLTEGAPRPGIEGEGRAPGGSGRVDYRRRCEPRPRRRALCIRIRLVVARACRCRSPLGSREARILAVVSSFQLTALRHTRVPFVALRSQRWNVNGQGREVKRMADNRACQDPPSCPWDSEDGRTGNKVCPDPIYC
jgi:hypothetical protein